METTELVQSPTGLPESALVTTISSAETDWMPAVRGGDLQRISRPSLSYWQDAWIRLKKNKQALAAMAVAILMVSFSVVGPFIWTVSPTDQDLARISEAPALARASVVLPEPTPYEDIVVAGMPEKPAEGWNGTLGTPGDLEVMGTPTMEAVRLKWKPVPNASSYVIYRSDVEPSDRAGLGIPLGETDAGNKVSFQDTFDVKPQVYFYSVVAKGANDEAAGYATVKVELKPGVSLENARAINPNAQPGETLKLASRPLGTDYLGRDMIARLMLGGRVSLFIGFLAPLFATLIGVMIGGIAGFFGGKLDEWLMRFADFILALPFLLCMILLRVAFGVQAGESGISALLISLVALSWTTVARLTRGQVLQLRESEFVQAAKLLGARPFYLLLRHLLPNTLGVLLVSLTFAIPTAIFTEAFLSFIGMGVAPPTPSWGQMCADGVQRFLTNPHEFFLPAMFISMTVLAFNLLGDGLRDALDPRMRSQE